MSAEIREISGAFYKAVRFAEQLDQENDGATGFVEIWPGEIRNMPAPVVANLLPYQFSWHGESVYGMPETFRHASPLRMYSAPAAVIGHDGAVELASGLLYRPSTQFVKPHIASSLFRQHDNQLWVRIEPEVNAPDGKYFAGFNAAWDNYAHVLTDTLPLLYFYRHYLMTERYRLVVPPLSLAPLHDELIDLLEIDREQLYLMPNERVRFGDLSFTTGISLWSQTGLLNIAAEALIDRVLGRTENSGRARQRPDKRLYLSRQDATTRQLLHEPALIKRLERLGFEVIQCSQLNLEQQILLFQQAELVVAPHGAALMNVLFCQRGAGVLELFPEYCVQPHYRGLAAWRTLKYGYLVGTSFEQENSRAVQDSWASDFVIDEDLVIDGVVKLLDSRGAPLSDPAGYQGHVIPPQTAERTTSPVAQPLQRVKDCVISDKAISFGDIEIFLLNGDNSGDFLARDDLFFMAKNAAYIAGYDEIRRDFETRSMMPRTVLEIGIFRGGSAPFLHRFFNAERVVCVDRVQGPVIPLENYRSRYPNVITAHYGVDQADRTAMREVIETDFAEPIDLVVDDASHFYEETKAAFETVFPYVRPGGIYVVEDWSWAHDAGAQQPDHYWADKPALTNLIFQLVMMQCDPGIIDYIVMRPGLAWVRRGSRPLPKGSFCIDEHTPSRGRTLNLI
jgi:capsular polysaccharide biosynthesis protein